MSAGRPNEVLEVESHAVEIPCVSVSDPTTGAASSWRALLIIQDRTTPPSVVPSVQASATVLHRTPLGHRPDDSQPICDTRPPVTDLVMEILLNAHTRTWGE